MPTHDEIAAAVFAALTDRDRQHLAEAIAAAALSEDGDASDDWYIDMSNAGVPIPGGAGEPVTERQLRLACRLLADAKAAPQTDAVEWECLLQGAFGHVHVARFEALYARIPLGEDTAVASER